jgi:DNA replication protein DnaC
MTHPKYPTVKKYKSKDFRTVKILSSEINQWKWYFLGLIQDEFFKSQKTIQLDESNKSKIAFCFDWIIGSVDITLNKGLLLRGDVGTGKSSILKAIKTLISKLYDGIFILYLTSDQITHVYKLNGDEFEKRINQINTCKILFIDDIGYEALRIFEHSPIAEVIRERYDKKRVTCITTNMSVKELAERYGNSFEDKINEMCFIVQFNGKSKR